ncbi:TfoX/Sxy family DNA transformation protein [Pantoea sp. FN060301]|uniref:TfoX/Sxy family DNA transformation protein n=1 Tax=Pantoea sp. FN060301 TaxID=3420380 RepID=UPI003D1844A3
MRDSKRKIERAKQYLNALGEINSRSQFGGYSLSVEKVVFALVAEGELYLRACEQVKPYFIQRQMAMLHFNKRGIPVEMDYYRVDETLWQQPEQLIALSRLCLAGAQRQRRHHQNNRRLKDLPNLSMRLELQLRRAGIETVDKLKEQGARACWLRLRESNKNLSINVLFALEGAILGRHQQALPESVKDELRRWYNTAATQPSQLAD